jgi:hypothetical protein
MAIDRENAIASTATSPAGTRPSEYREPIAPPHGARFHAWMTRLTVGSEILAWVSLAATLVAMIPLFLRLMTWGDTVLFDLAAKSLLRHGSFYRNVFMHGPPGMVWCQLAVRSQVGWSSIALRCADLAILAVSILLMLRTCGLGRQARAASVWLAAILFLCYFMSTEWAHCQPDSWMLMPALAALSLRQRQVASLDDDEGRKYAAVVRGLAEGGLWSVAFLMKPFVVVPAALCLCVSLLLMHRHAQLPGRQAFRNVASLFVGAAGVMGGAIAVLIGTGDWNEFVASTFGGWNSDYLRFSADWGHRTVEAVTQWPVPWSAIHALAVPVAFLTIALAVRGQAWSPESSPGKARRALFAAFYLGWFFQANYLQLQFEYQTLPALLLAWCVLGATLWAYAPRLTVLAALPAAAVAIAVLHHPLLAPNRMACWSVCWKPGGSDHLMDTLGLNWGEGHTSREDLRGVINFLKSRHAADREVTCWHWSTIPVYTEMDIEPSTRFVFPGSRLGYFPTFKKVILDETMSSPQRFLVADLYVTKGPKFNYHQPMDFPLDSFQPFKPVYIFHSGRYIVLEFRSPSPADSKSD